MTTEYIYIYICSNKDKYGVSMKQSISAVLQFKHNTQNKLSLLAWELSLSIFPLDFLIRGGGDAGCGDDQFFCATRTVYSLSSYTVNWFCNTCAGKKKGTDQTVVIWSIKKLDSLFTHTLLVFLSQLGVHTALQTLSWCDH